MRGRRCHARHMSSVTLPELKLGIRGSWKVLRPISLFANLSSMYTFMPCTMETTAIRKVTPISTPIREKKLLSFWTRMVSSAIPTASRSIMSGGGLPRRRRVARHPAVAQRHHPRRVGCDVGLVGDHDDGLPLGVQGLEDPHDLLARGAVEVSGRLVRQENGGLVHQRSGDRHPLPLAAGKLVGPVVHPVREPDPAERA